MRNVLLYSLIVMVLFLPGYSGSKGNPNNTALTDYQKDVITYFKEIALGFEFGTASRVTRKWAKPMKIYVGGTPGNKLALELELIVAELNSLITDGFRIEIVDNREASNFHIYFGGSASYSRLYPADAQLARTNSGVYHIYWNFNNQITRGNIFIKTEGTSLEEQRSVLREELTQSLGLGRDSALYPESIFQSKFTTPTQYAPIDRDIIRLLYHPDMRVGLSENDTESKLAEILLGESFQQVVYSANVGEQGVNH